MNYEEIKGAKPQKRGKVVDVLEDQDSYVIQLDENKIFQVASIAYYIWKMCDGTKTVQEIVDEISKAANLSEAEVSGPVTQILEELSKAELIVI
ncbi:MAG: PqqD family protein [Sulfolobales archaeon]|nr:PqqD family protein [Sulfolobales archaeon]MCG2893690.1 PqqD family protein [Sulfolobales archaeon]MCG2911104.1 PqqD family protein [Sulfolobales archaeon]